MELFDLVDVNDQVVGTTNKALAHANRLLHRLAAVYVFNSKGELFVQIHKKSGGRYDHSVGGHVQKGESYDSAARREAAEELGLDQPLNHLSTVLSDKGSYAHIISMYECTVDPAWQFVPNEEVEEIVPLSLEQLKKLMRATPEKFTSGFISTFERYLELRNIN